MDRLNLVAFLLVAVGCSATPLGAQRDAQRAYEDCVELNGAPRCTREKEIAEKRRQEVNERDLNRGPTRALDRY